MSCQRSSGPPRPRIEVRGRGWHDAAHTALSPTLNTAEQEQGEVELSSGERRVNFGH